MAESNEQPQVSKGFTNSGGLSGAALKRMQELAQSLYDSTPGLQEGISLNPITPLELPRHTSKILSTAKKPQTTATALLGEFDRKGFNGAGDTYLRKVDKKDLSKGNYQFILNLEGAVTAEDWETKYREAWERFKLERIETLRLKDRMAHKQERYIAREQEYRKTIEQIEKDIEQHSIRPLRII